MLFEYLKKKKIYGKFPKDNRYKKNQNKIYTKTYKMRYTKRPQNKVKKKKKILLKRQTQLFAIKVKKYIAVAFLSGETGLCEPHV